LPELDLKIANNSDETCILTEVLISVASSRPDNRPILILSEGEEPFSFTVTNEGWGSARNVAFDFRVVPSNSDVNLPEEAIVDLSYSHHCGDVSIRETINVANVTSIDGAGQAGEIFQALYGIKGTIISAENPIQVANLQLPRVVQTDQGEKVELTTEELSARLEKILGPFMSGSADVVGLFRYEADDQFGEPKVYSNPVSLPLTADRRLRAGALLPPSASYAAELRSFGADYRVSVPISHMLAPGEADRIKLTLTADQSSMHTMRVDIRSMEKIIYGTEIDLTLFFPRSWRTFSIKKA